MIIPDYISTGDETFETVLKICLCKKTCMNYETLEAIEGAGVIIHVVDDNGDVVRWKPRMDLHGNLKIAE